MWCLRKKDSIYKKCMLDINALVQIRTSAKQCWSRSNILLDLCHLIRRSSLHPLQSPTQSVSSWHVPNQRQVSKSSFIQGATSPAYCLGPTNRIYQMLVSTFPSQSPLSIRRASVTFEAFHQLEYARFSVSSRRDVVLSLYDVTSTILFHIIIPSLFVVLRSR